jgi:hypothetical protein
MLFNVVMMSHAQNLVNEPTYGKIHVKSCVDSFDDVVVITHDALK